MQLAALVSRAVPARVRFQIRRRTQNEQFVPTKPRPALDGRPVGGLPKRAFDVALAGTALVVLSPVILAAAIMVRMQDGGPALYGHRRIGRGGTTFRCLKLRSMVVDSDRRLAEYLAANPEAAREWELTQKLKDDPRVTRLGAFLRKSSLDELPQLINVVRGEMSLVGPRPVVESELTRYGSRRSRYLAARPGLTGPWQISGRNDTTYRRRVALDVVYVDRWSLARDIVIVTRTVPAVLKSRGTY